MAEQSGEVTAEGSEGEWMNTAFALDDLHERADLQALAVDLDTLDRQLQPLASPIAPLDMASMALASFLSEIDACSNVIADPKQPERIGSLPQTATPAPERAGALRLMPKKKKLSSLQRTRQAKALVQLEIAQLEQRIKHIRREHYQALALRRAKRWKPIVQNEVQQTETKNAEQLQLWTSIKNEQQRARVALEFVMKMRELMQASLARIPLCVPRLETDQDAAIFHALAWNVRVKSQALDCVLPTHSAASELSLGKLSANGECAELEFVRFLPFDVPTTSRVTWNCAQSDFGSAHTAVNKIYADDTRAIMQDFVLPVSHLHDVTLKIQVVCKRFVNDRRTVFLWEGLSHWLTPADGSSTSTHEHGAIVIEPLGSAADLVAMSSLKGYVRLTSVNPGLLLQLSKCTLAGTVLPAFENVMNVRHSTLKIACSTLSGHHHAHRMILRRLTHLFNTEYTCKRRKGGTEVIDRHTDTMPPMWERRFH